MRRTFFLLIVFVLSSLVTATAQNWNDDQLDVINSLKGCWDTWLSAIEQGDPEIWISECTDGDYTYWWASQGAPNNPETLRRDFEKAADTDEDWLDIRPLAVKIVGDVAIMHFYGYWRAKTPDGSTTTEALRTEIFQKVNGKWLLVAGHSTPASQADADPYK